MRLFNLRLFNMIKVIVPIIILALSQTVHASPVELSLDDCVTLALNNNPDIKIATAGREKSFWAVNEAKAAKGFSLSYTHTAARYNTPPTYLISRYTYTTNFDNELALSLPVYSGGKLESEIKQARLNYTIANLNIDAVRQQLKQSVTSCYFSVLQYDKAQQVSKETVDNYKHHLEKVQAQFDAGVVAKSDVLASAVSLADAQDSLIKAQNNYDLAVANLNNTIGLPLDSQLKLKEDLKYEKYSASLAECASQALANRPEIAEYQAKIDIAKEDIKIAKSGYLPTVTFAATQDWYDEKLPGDKNSNWLVSLTASLTIFDSGLNKAKAREANCGLDTAKAEAAQIRDTILLEVRQYYLNLREAEKRIDTSKVALEEAAENVRIAELRYEAGIGTNLDVLDAVLSQNTAKLNYIQAMYDYNTSKAQLVRTMGLPAN